MDPTLLQKIVLAVVLAVWAAMYFKKRKRPKTQDADAAIANANAQERYNWRYLRWSFRAVQFLCVAWIVWTYLKIILS